MTSARPDNTPGMLAFDLIALDPATRKQGICARAVVDAGAARMLIAGLTGASTFSNRFSMGDLASWMAQIFGTFYPDSGGVIESGVLSDKSSHGSGYAFLLGSSDLELDERHMRTAAAELKRRFGALCQVEVHPAVVGGKGPSLPQWIEAHPADSLAHADTHEFLSTAYLIFVDHKLPKSSKASAPAIEDADE